MVVTIVEVKHAPIKINLQYVVEAHWVGQGSAIIFTDTET